MEHLDTAKVLQLAVSHEGVHGAAVIEDANVPASIAARMVQRADAGARVFICNAVVVLFVVRSSKQSISTRRATQ